MKTGELINSLDSHTGSVSHLDMFDQPFLGTTNVLVSASFDKSIKLWNIYTGECLMTLKVCILFFFLNYLLTCFSRDMVILLHVLKLIEEMVPLSVLVTIKR